VITVALVLGALSGLSALAATRLLFPQAPPLQAALDRLARRDELVRNAGAERGDDRDASDLLGRTTGASIGRALRGAGLSAGSLGPDLTLVGRSLDQHLGQKALVSLFGFALAPLGTMAASLGGVGTGVVLPTVFSVMAGFAFFFVPDLALRREAEARRVEFRHSLGSFLDLVVISLAGGAGVESALRDAAGIGRGWAYVQLRDALEVTALTGETPWAALARLGRRLGVEELSELAASVSLAGTEGARVRESLAVKASSLRSHALARAETEAQSSTETMAVPVVLLFVGFLILIGYPAIDAVLTTV